MPVSVTVVDELEVVEIHEGHRERLGPAHREGHRQLELLLEGAVIAKVRQRVARGALVRHSGAAGRTSVHPPGRRAPSRAAERWSRTGASRRAGRRYGCAAPSRPTATLTTNGRSPRCMSARKSRCDPCFRVSTSSPRWRVVGADLRRPRVEVAVARGRDDACPRGVRSCADTTASRSSIESTRSSASSIPSKASSPSAYAFSIAFASAAYERASCWSSSLEAARVKNIWLATIINATLANSATTSRSTKVRRRANCAIANPSLRPIRCYSAGQWWRHTPLTG